MLDVKRLVVAERAGIVRIDWPETATQDEVLAGMCEWLAVGLEDFKRIEAGVIARRPQDRSGFFAFQHSEQRG
jgi:hypothetical protein